MKMKKEKKNYSLLNMYNIKKYAYTIWVKFIN